MSFGGKSFKREEMRMKRELHELSKQSKSEYSYLNIDDKSRLRLKKIQRAPRKREKNSFEKKSGTRRLIGTSEIDNGELNEGELEDTAEVPPPSPSIDLGPELRSSPAGTDTPSTVVTNKETDIGNSLAYEQRRSGLNTRSTGVVSIRSRVDFSVVMQGKGLVDQGNSSAGSTKDTKKSMAKPQSAEKLQSPLRKTPLEEKQTKPAIIGSQSTAVAVQLTPRPSPRQNQRPSSGASIQNAAKGRTSSVSTAEVIDSSTPAAFGKLEDAANVYHTPEKDVSGCKKEDMLESSQADPEENGIHNKDLHVIVDIDENAVAWEEDKDPQFDPLNDTSQLSLTRGSDAEIHVEEEKSPVDRIHSEILELTRKISLPDAGILSLIKASEEAVDEAKKQQGSPPSKESLLMRVLAEQQNSNLSIYGDLKSISTPILPKTPFANNKGIPHNDDQAVGTENTVIDKEGPSERPRKGTRVTVASEASGGEGTSRQDGPPMTADRTADAGGSEMTGRDVLASQSGYEFGSRQELPSQRIMTDEQAFKTLLLPPEVAPEDIISIKGQQVEVFTKEVMAPVNSVEFVPNEAKGKWIRVKEQKEVTFLDSWHFKETDKEVKPIKTHNIHHFCTMPASVELPPYLCRVTRDEHTRDRFSRLTGRPVHAVFTDGLSWIEEEGNEEGEEDETIAKSQRNAEQRRWSVVAQEILNKAAEAEDTDEMLVRLKNASDELFSAGAGENLDIAGIKIQLKDDTSRLYWTPAPPKMNLAPATIKSHLCPDYQSATLFQESLATDYRTATGVDSDDNDENQGEVDSEAVKARNRILSREHGSMSDLHKLEVDARPVQRPKTDYGGVGDDYARLQTEGKDRFTSVLDQRRHEIKLRGENETKDTVLSDGPHGPEELSDKTNSVSVLRSMSHPLLSVSERILKVPAGYDISMDELNYQRDQISAIKAKLEDRDSQEAMAPSQSVLLEKSATAATITSHGRSTIMDLHDQSREFYTDEGRTDTENMSVQTTVSRATGVTKISKRKLPHRKLRKKTKKELEREQEIQEFLQQTARQISRSKSFTDLGSLAKEEKEDFKQENESRSTRVDLGKASSVPTILDLDKFIIEDLTGPSDEVFDDIRERFWYVWFDEVYPPTPALPEIKFDLQSLSTPRPDTRSKSTVVIVNNDLLDDIQVIEPQVSTTDQQLYQALQEEVVRLTDLIDATEKKELCAIHLCRRGAVYRKIGQLKKAWDDLNRSIELEPKLLDAYWHRHLLHLLQDNRKAALDDLTFIIKNSSTQARAFRSRAELYRQESDATMAIVNYSQAIKLNPNDAETYYQRAAMFKMRGDMILALEDYKMAAKLLPSKTEAMFEIGVYHFNNQNWLAACNDFTELLHQDPEDSKAYTYRARAHAKMDNYEAALKDLAAAVHYDPNNAVAFYHRGCLLRKVHPKRALQDFSVSLLLDSSLDNVKCFLHRGILYTELKRWEDAIPDFEAALQLDSSVASAHVNIGLIYIFKYSNYHKAVRRYTAAIRVDPTYIRAYICRAEANHKLHLLQDAILDYTRVIHMRPDISDYHMARGKLLLEQNKLELASFHVRQAADLNRGLGASATQQAVVQSFLRNFDQAIEVLERATRVRPVAPLFILLGKTYMKAKRFQNAINSFERAIEIMTPWNSRMEIPIEAAGVHFLIGMCQSELGRPLDALEAFNSAIKVNPDYAEAFYQRGLTKMKLKHAKGIHDFNRALAINPTLFQAFLSRAAYYGMKGRHSKGIMSCNEAIKLQPRSVRAYLYRGALKYNIKAYSLAVKDLTEAVAIDCKCSLAYFNRAVCYHEMRFFQKALMDYGTVMLLEEKPNLKVLQNRGLLYFEIDDMENALQDFLAASKVSPGDPKLRHTLGLCYHRLNRLEEAVLSYNGTLRIDPFFVEAYNGRGNALMDFGHEDGTVLGRHDYLKALHMDPLCLSVRVNLGYNLQVEGKFQAAWNQFSAAITIDSNCQSALEGRAVVNLQMGNSFGAFVDMNDAIKISKTAELLTNRGVVQQFMGDSVNAIRDYQAAVRTDPSYALAYYNAANIYFIQRQFHQALNYYNKALLWYADDESAVLNRAITKVMLKDSKGAIQDFNRAVELNPYAAHVYFNRGNLFASMRRYKEAEEDYTRALSLRPGDALVYKRRADVLGRHGKKAAAIQDYRRAIVIQTTKP